MNQWLSQGEKEEEKNWLLSPYSIFSSFLSIAQSKHHSKVEIPAVRSTSLTQERAASSQSGKEKRSEKGCNQHFYLVREGLSGDNMQQEWLKHKG